MTIADEPSNGDSRDGAGAGQAPATVPDDVNVLRDRERFLQVHVSVAEEPLRVRVAACVETLADVRVEAKDHTLGMCRQ